MEATSEHRDARTGLVDVHCHILPGLDDGALDLADSVAMARQARGDGIAVVCATPHIRHDHDVRIPELPEAIAALQAELERLDIDVRIAAGGEIGQHAAAALTRAELRMLSLDGGGWILLEPAPGPLGVELERLVERLAARGARAIVAHPERHAGEDLEERLRALVAQGCLIQWTAEFIALERGGEYVRRLARDGLVHLLGSDSHSSHGGRPLHLRPAVERLAQWLTPERVEWIAHEAPWGVLRGQALKPPW